MDSSTMTILVIVIFALVALAAFMRFGRRVKVGIKGPGGIGLDVDASNEPAPLSPGVRIHDVKSRSGGLTAMDQTGRVDVERAEVEKDINVTSAPPRGDVDPKV